MLTHLASAQHGHGNSHYMELLKMFKKLLTALCASVVVFSLAGCGDKEETKTFKANINGVEMSLTYTYSGDKVIKQTAENKIAYSSIGAKNKEEAQTVLGPIGQKYQGVEGVEEKINYEDTYAEETVKIDYTKADTAKLKELMGAMSTGDVSKGVSMKQSQALLEAQGFKEVK